ARGRLFVYAARRIALPAAGAISGRGRRQRRAVGQRDDGESAVRRGVHVCAESRSAGRRKARDDDQRRHRQTGAPLRRGQRDGAPARRVESARGSAASPGMARGAGGRGGAGGVGGGGGWGAGWGGGGCGVWWLGAAARWVRRRTRAAARSARRARPLSRATRKTGGQRRHAARRCADVHGRADREVKPVTGELVTGLRGL